jgi:hypothetical protein
MSGLVRFAVMLLSAVLAAGAAASNVKNGTVPKAEVSRVTPYLGDYEGQWDAALSRYEMEQPVMRLSLDARNRLRVQFFMDSVAAAHDEPLDLLGFGCQSKVGPLLTLDFPSAQAGAGELQQQFDASFEFDWGRCPSRVYAVPSNNLLLSLAANPDTHEYVATLKLLRKVSADDKVYAVSGKQRREVKVRPKAGGGGSVYKPELEYCITNEVGEIDKCFAQESELKRFLVPFPFPGMSGVWYTKKTPQLKVEKGVKFEYHEAVFRREMPSSPKSTPE